MYKLQALQLRYAFLLRAVLLLVGLHSILLGMTIYFFTIPFYQIFFATEPGNIFFVKQSGVFLFLIGLFYLLPLAEAKNNFFAIGLVIFSKITAVIFLLGSASLTPAPAMIHLAALGDGLMAAALFVLCLLYYKR